MNRRSVLRGPRATGFVLAELEPLGSTIKAEDFLLGSVFKVEALLADFCLSERAGRMEAAD